jgi:hypothetical protein
MRLTRSLATTLLILCAASSVHAQKRDTNFPTDDEVRLVLTQAQRAVGEYKPLLDMQEKMLGKAGADAVAKDREIVHGLEVGIAGFGKNPQAFNSSLGFAFFEWLDDACRNALLSSLSATNNAAVNMIDGDKEKAQANIDLAKDLSNVSTMFYTVSENAGALYSRYTEGEEELAKQGVKAATDCTTILKEQKNIPE